MKKILLLQDSRASNTKQSEAIASGLAKVLRDYSVVPVKVAFSPFAFLPNFLIPNFLMGKVKSTINDKFDVIISCGRRLAKFSLYAKTKYGKTGCKVVAMLNPGMPCSTFDSVILPRHDGVAEKSNNNIVNIDGAIVKIQLEDMSNSWISKTFHAPYIAVMIGGSSKNVVFTKDDSDLLVEKLDAIATSMDATLLITTSRRTPKFVISTIKEKLTCSYYLYDFNNTKTPNPYNSFLSIADYCICTYDSISMISEILDTQKPLYLFKYGKDVRKYSDFLQFLIEKGCIRVFNYSDSMLEKYKYEKVNNINNISLKLAKKLNLL